MISIFFDLVDFLSSLTGFSESTIYLLLIGFAFIIVAQIVSNLMLRSKTNWIPYKGIKQRSHLSKALRAIKDVKKMNDSEALNYLATMNGFTFELLVYISLTKCFPQIHHPCPIKLTGDMGLDGYFASGKTLNIIQSKSYRLDGFINTSDVDKFIKTAFLISKSKNKKSVMKRTRTNEVKGFFVSTGRLSGPAIRNLDTNGIKSINNLGVVSLVKGQII